MPGMKNTEYGIGALSKARERCTRSLDSTRNVPAGVRYPGLPLVIGTGPYSTTPPRSSHALLWARSMQARTVAAHGTPGGLAGLAGGAGAAGGAAGAGGGAAGAGAGAASAGYAAGRGATTGATTCAAAPHTAAGSARATAVTPPAITPAATASASPTTTLDLRMAPRSDRPHRTRSRIRHGTPADNRPNGQDRRLGDMRCACAPHVPETAIMGSRQGRHRVGGELLVGEVEVDRRVLAQLREPVVAVDHADGAGLGPHDDRLRRAPARPVVHAAEEVAVGDPGGAEERVVALNEVVDREHPPEVVARVEGLALLVLVLRPQPPLHRAAHALQRGGRDDPLRGAADAVEQVDGGVGAGRGDRARDVAVADELDAGAGAADLFDQLGVPGPVEHAHPHVVGLDALGGRDPADVLGHGDRDVDGVGRLRPHGQLLHVEHRRRVEHGAPLGHREHRDRAGHALGHERGAVDGVDGDVAPRALTVADLLAVEQHGRLVLLALADHDDAPHGDAADELAHRVDRGPVAAVLVAAAHPPACRHRGGLGDPHQLHGEVAVGGLAAA